MKFKKLEKSGKRYDGIHIMCSYQVCVSSQMTRRIMELYPKVKRIDFEIDVKNKAVLIKPVKGENEGYKIHVSYRVKGKPSGINVACGLYNEMEDGKYYFKKITSEGIICQKK